jgi:AbrB family looped-hinge helix DNA binding protein
MKNMKPTKDLQYGSWEQFFYGSVTVGERGQIVIPAEARAEMEINAGDKLLIMRHPVHKGLNIFKFEAVREFLDDFQKTLNKLEKESTESSV